MRKLEIVGVKQASDWFRYGRPTLRALEPDAHLLDPCPRCSAPCCREPIVRLTVVETLRIAFALTIRPAEFVEFVEAEKEMIQGWPIVTQEGRAFLRLRHEGGHCVNALAYGRGLRCGIWAVRPGPCRQFPFHVRHGEKRVQVGDQRFCEVKWLQDDALVASMTQSMERWSQDLDFDKTWVKIWNCGKRRSRTFEAFERWMLADVAPALGYDAQAFAPLPQRTLGETAHGS